jgi:hypothetical protein
MQLKAAVPHLPAWRAEGLMRFEGKHMVEQFMNLRESEQFDLLDPSRWV